MGRICLSYLREPERDRWIPGDRFIRPIVRRLLRGRPRPSGLDKVVINLCLGLDRLGMAYELNMPYSRLRPDDMPAVLGRGRQCLSSYKTKQPLVAGIGLMTHPSEWPTLFNDYPVVSYLQHSEWAADVYRRYFGPDRCDVWPVGIDTEQWLPSSPASSRPFDFLIYEKIRWDRAHHDQTLVAPISALLARLGFSSTTLHYGFYEPADFHAALAASKAMIFLSSHESQGISSGEALACDVPVFAWDPGRCLDPERSAWNDVDFPTTSVPYFDERCGARFADFGEFEAKLPIFVDSVRRGAFAPRDYIMDNLTVEKCSSHFVEILRRRLG